MKIEITEIEQNTLNFFYGFLQGHENNIKEETDLDTAVKVALKNNLPHLESILRKLNDS